MLAFVQSVLTNFGFKGGGLLTDSTTSVTPWPPLVLFYVIHFWPIAPIIFQKAPLTPVVFNFKESPREKSGDVYLNQNFTKSTQKRWNGIFLPDFWNI